jgi:anti-sigma regulatory factor (Ser/Thr protein kinase)
MKSIEIKVNSHIGSTPQFDDITMLVLRRKLTADDNIHKISIEAKIENLPSLMEFVEKACYVSIINKKVTFAFKLAVDEACTNIIDHGYENLKPGLIDLTFQTKHDEAILSIHDDGRSFDPKQSVDVATNVDFEDRQVGGLGLVLIKKMADKIQYNSDPEKGNELILSKKFKK